MSPSIFVREADQSDVTTLAEYNIYLADETESIFLNKATLRFGIYIQSLEFATLLDTARKLKR